MKAIKKTIAILLTVMLAALSIAPISVFAATNLAYQNYDGTYTEDATSNFSGSGSGGFPKVDGGVMTQLAGNLATTGHTWAAKVEKSANAYWSTEWRQGGTSSTGVYSMSCDFVIPSTIKQIKDIRVDNTAGARQIRILLQKSGTTGSITVEDGSGTGNVKGTGTFELDEWNRLEILQNKTDGKLTVKVDGIKIADFEYDKATNTTNLKFALITMQAVSGETADDGSYMLLDNLSCDEGEYTAPSTGGDDEDNEDDEDYVLQDTYIDINEYSGAYTEGEAAVNKTGTKGSTFIAYNTGTVTMKQMTGTLADADHPWAAEINPTTYTYGGASIYKGTDTVDPNAVSTTFEFDYYINAPDSNPAIVARVQNTSLQSIINVIMTKNGVNDVTDSSGTSVPGKVEVSTTGSGWNNFKVVYTTETKEVEVFINDTFCGKVTYDLTGTYIKWTMLSFASHDSTKTETIYVDNIKTYKTMKVEVPVFKVKNLEFVTADGNALETLAAGPVNVKATVKNTINQPKTFELILAVYDGNTLKDVKREKKTIAANANVQSFTLDTNITYSSGTIKGFVWDSMTSLRPLIPSVSK